VVDGGVAELADATADLIIDPIALGKLRREVEALRISHTADLVVEDFVSVWAAQ
jgi:hypothetical protein